MERQLPANNENLDSEVEVTISDNNLSDDASERLYTDSIDENDSPQAIATDQYVAFATDEYKNLDDRTIDAALVALNNACKTGPMGLRVDKKAIFQQLSGWTENDLERINEGYENKYGFSLSDHLSKVLRGADRFRALSMAEGNFDSAARVRCASLELGQKVFGRSNKACEQDLRDTISTLNSGQIADMLADYKQRCADDGYGGNLPKALSANENISGKTKAAVDIYLKGTDFRTDNDVIALANIALQARDLDMFKEAFRFASPSARLKFAQSDSYRDMVNIFKGDINQASDYLWAGQLSVPTKLDENIGFTGANKKAIQHVLESMDGQERSKFWTGYMLNHFAQGNENITPEQRDASNYYRIIHDTLKHAGSEAEVCAWENKAMFPGAKLATALEPLLSQMGRSNLSQVLSAVENMNEVDWRALNSHPAYRQQVEGMLRASLNPYEQGRVGALLDRKQDSRVQNLSYEEMQLATKRPVLETINDSRGYFRSDKNAVMDAIRTMSPNERAYYSGKGRAAFEQAITNVLGRGANHDAALFLADAVFDHGGKDGHVLAGKQLISKFKDYAVNLKPETPALISDIQTAFRAAPQLREAIVRGVHGKGTAEDRTLANDFMKAVHGVFSAKEVQHLVQPLVDRGHLPIGQYSGLFSKSSRNKSGVFELLGNCVKSDLEQIIRNPDRALPFLNVQEREIAMNVARQEGEVRPEDELRLGLLGSKADGEKIKDILQNLNPVEKIYLRDEYGRKYGSDLVADIHQRYKGNDKDMVEGLLLPTQLSAGEIFNSAREAMYRDNRFGRWWVDHFWDGTGVVTDDALNKFSGEMAESSARFTEMPQESAEKFARGFYQALELYKESKVEAADKALKITMASVSIAAGPPTSGLSLNALPYACAGGALVGVLNKMAILGMDYQVKPADPMKGAFYATSAILSPVQYGYMMEVGQNAAQKAAGHLLEIGANRLSDNDNIKSALVRGMRSLVADSLRQGKFIIEDERIGALAKAVASRGNEKAIASLIKETLGEAVIEESTQLVRNSLLQNSNSEQLVELSERALKTGLAWDKQKPLVDNLLDASKSLSIASGSSTTVGRILTAVPMLANSEARKHSSGNIASDIAEGLHALQPGAECAVMETKNPAGTRYLFGEKPHYAGMVPVRFASFAKDKDGNLSLNNKSNFNVYVRRAGYGQFERVAPGSKIPLQYNDEIRFGSLQETGLKRY